MKILTGEDVFSPTLTAPKDGEVWNEATIQDALIKKLLDNTAYLKNRLELTPTTYTVAHNEASDDPSTWSPWTAVSTTSYDNLITGSFKLTLALVPGDVVIIDADVTTLITGSGTSGVVEIVTGTISPLSVHQYQSARIAATTTRQRQHIALFPGLVVASPGQSVDVWLRGRVLAASTDVNLCGPATLRAVVFHSVT